MSQPLRIANCSGFYGDRLAAAREQVLGGPIDVLTGDWLAELTMMILARDQQDDPSTGYAKTFLAQFEQVLAPCIERGIKIVSNAGGLNPHGLAAALSAIAEKHGKTVRIAVVDGDDLRPKLAALKASGHAFTHLDTGAPLDSLQGKLLAANAYLGASGIQLALQRGADVVITGRVTDAAVVVGPAAWRFGWGPEDLHALAGATLAGHIIECGCQATGGNYSFFEEIPNLDHPGFPIAEIYADGSSVITKHPGTGGLVSVGTVTAQLLYEVGSPRYVSPDVIAHLDSVHLSSDGPDRVRLSGARGSAAPSTLKAGLVLATGWRNSMTAVLSGSQVEAKAARLSHAFWKAAGGQASYERTQTDLIDGSRPDPMTQTASMSLLTFSARDPDPKKVARRFTSPAVELALASVPGLTWTHPPRPPMPVGIFWPTLVSRDEVTQTVHLDGQITPVPWPPRQPTSEALRLHEDFDDTTMPLSAPETGVIREIELGELVGARSGDKAGLANVGFWVRRPDHWPWLLDTLSVETLQRWLAESGFHGRISRHELPNLLAVNFVLEGWLDEGVSASLNADPQAKGLAEWLRAKRVFVDKALLP